MNDKIIRRLIYFLILLIITNLVYNLFFSSRNLKQALKKIEAVESELTIVQEELNSAKIQTSKMKQEVENTSNFLKKINIGVRILELDRRNESKIWEKDKKTISQTIDSLTVSLDNLPDIDEK